MSQTPMDDQPVDGIYDPSKDTEDDGLLGPEDTLEDRGVDDPLDEGYSPPEKPREVDRFGTTAEEMRQGESLDQRIAQEEPDPAAAFDDPLAEPDTVGGDDPDAIAAEDDWLGDDEVGDERAGRLVAPDEGAHEDVDAELVAGDVGIDGGAASAEEAAVHVIHDTSER